jgi:hypothetical protein
MEMLQRQKHSFSPSIHYFFTLIGEGSLSVKEEESWLKDYLKLLAKYEREFRSKLPHPYVAFSGLRCLSENLEKRQDWSSRV